MTADNPTPQQPDTIMRILEDFHYGAEHHASITYSDPKLEIENQWRIHDCNEKRDEAHQQLEVYVAEAVRLGKIEEIQRIKRGASILDKAGIMALLELELLKGQEAR